MQHHQLSKRHTLKGFESAAALRIENLPGFGAAERYNHTCIVTRTTFHVTRVTLVRIAQRLADNSENRDDDPDRNEYAATAGSRIPLAAEWTRSHRGRERMRRT